MSNGIRSYETEMKKVQLAKKQIPTSVLLVDEAQDLDEAQVSWVESQQAYGECSIPCW